MGKQSRPRKAESFGKGKVTPVQVAFIVDRYLSDNNFPGTRSAFRSEASSLISKSPVREAPKSLLSLGAMLDEYICLKEQKVMLDQERVRLDQEKSRVQSLLQGMQNVMSTYNASASAPVHVVPLVSGAKSVPVAPRSGPPVLPHGQPVNSTRTVIPVPGLSNSRTERNNIASSVTSNPSERRKRGLEVATEAGPDIKKSRDKTSYRKFVSQGNRIPQQGTTMNDQVVVACPTPVDQASPTDTAANKSMAQVSSVAKCLFSHLQPQVSPPNNSSGPNTPPQAVSPESDKSVTPAGASSANCSNYCSPQEITPTNCTIISSERVTVSPLKQMTCYTIERNHSISSCSPVKANLKRPSKRDHVKSRLDFDVSDVTKNFEPSANEISTSESDKEADIFDLDFPNFDALGPNFSFSELLVDLDLDCEGIGFPCQPTTGPSGDTLSGSSHESGGATPATEQIMSEFSSTVTEVISEKDMHAQGPDSVTSVKSITKCIRIVSPVKGSGNSLDRENCSSVERLA